MEHHYKGQHFTGFSIKYRSSPSDAWTDYRGGKVLPSGQKRTTRPDTVLSINLETFKASQVRISLHGSWHSKLRAVRYDLEVIADKGTPALIKLLHARKLGAWARAESCNNPRVCRTFKLNDKYGFLPSNNWRNTSPFRIEVHWNKPLVMRQIILKKRGDGDEFHRLRVDAF